MKKIYKWALEQSGASESMVKAVNLLKDEQAERFVEVVVGCEINNDEVPQEIVYNNIVHKLVRCNYILDEITYRCEESTTKYFKTQMDADKYEMNGSYSWDASSNTLKDEYTFAGVWTREVEHTTWYSRWFEWANKTM